MTADRPCFAVHYWADDRWSARMTFDAALAVAAAHARAIVVHVGVQP